MSSQAQTPPDRPKKTKTTFGKSTKLQSPALPRALSRKLSICKKLARSKDEPQYGSRAKTGQGTLSAKAAVLVRYPLLAVETKEGDAATRLVLHGVNSVRAETVDLISMVEVMRRNVTMLSHASVERFFEWIPLFAVYLERYMIVEEDFIFKWVERDGVDQLKGVLRPAARMVIRGKMQKVIRDVQAVQDRFSRHLPAGERLRELEDAVGRFSDAVVEYVDGCLKLVEVVRAGFSKGEIEKVRFRIVKHVVTHIGYQDFLAVYTRWMRPGELLEWKTSVLFPCDFKFFSYKAWEKDMDRAHYQIAAQFAELIEQEKFEADDMEKQSKMDFARALATRQRMEGGVPIMVTDEVVCEDEDD